MEATCSSTIVFDTRFIWFSFAYSDPLLLGTLFCRVSVDVESRRQQLLSGRIRIVICRDGSVSDLLRQSVVSFTVAKLYNDFCWARIRIAGGCRSNWGIDTFWRH